MTNNSKIIALLAKAVPGLLSRNSVNALVEENSISYLHAQEAMDAVTDATVVDPSGSDGEVSKGGDVLEKNAKLGYLSEAKFKAMLQAAQEDERFLYQEFQTIDRARDELIAKIASKEEPQINAVLHHLQTVAGVDQGIAQQLQGLKVKTNAIP
jgi:hypothetical protein